MSIAAPPVVNRRDVIIAAVEAHNCAHSATRLPRSAARLLAVMFPTEDVCFVSQEMLRAEGFGDTLPKVLRALVEAGFMSREPGTSRIPDTYRLQLQLEARP